MGWEYLVVLLISVIISVALAPKPTQPKPASLADFDIPVAEEGKEIPVVFGTVDIKGFERTLVRRFARRADLKVGRQKMMLVRMEHCREIGYCARGVRYFFQLHGLDFAKFLSEGLPADV